MKMLLGLVPKDSGVIHINGQEMEKHSRVEILKQVGSLIESPSYYGNLTAYENLQISCMLRGLPYREIDQVLSIVRLDGQKRKKTAHFSLGMKQRLGLANALLGFPKLVLLDEPTNGLDPSGIHEMRELIKSLPQQYGITVMISSHLLSEMEQTANYIGIISQGKLIFQDTLTLLKLRSRRGLRLRTSDPQKTVALCQTSPLADFLHSATLNNQDHHVLLPLLSDTQLSRLLRYFWEQNIEIYRVEEQSENLENLYLDMVKETGL